MSRKSAAPKTRQITVLHHELGYPKGDDPLKIGHYFQNNVAPSGRKLPHLVKKDLEEMAEAWLTEEVGRKNWPGGRNAIRKWAKPEDQAAIKEMVKKIFLEKWKRWMQRYHPELINPLKQTESKYAEPAAPILPPNPPTPENDNGDHRNKRLRLEKDPQALIDEASLNFHNTDIEHLMENIPIPQDREIIDILDNDEYDNQGYATTPASTRHLSSSSAEATDDTKASLRDQVVCHQKEHKYQRLLIKENGTEIAKLKDDIKSHVANLKKRAQEIIDLAAIVNKQDLEIEELRGKIVELEDSPIIHQITAEIAALREKNLGLEAEKEQLLSGNVDLKLNLEAPSQPRQEEEPNQEEQPNEEHRDPEQPYSAYEQSAYFPYNGGQFFCEDGTI